MSFATILREGTSEEHKAAEGSTFIRCFMKGILEKELMQNIWKRFILFMNLWKKNWNVIPEMWY